MNETAPPGYYPAQGDPPGTVRYWDGIQWSAEPMPPPPGYDPNRRPGDDRFATVWVRIGAAMVDGLVALLVLLPALVGYVGDLVDDIDAGGDGTTVPVPSDLYLYGIAYSVATVLMVAFLGGTPGKLLLGLRITTADGYTTPPGLGPAVVRWLPALLGIIPVIGVLIAAGLPIANVIMVNTDPERRSAYDRIAGTRVVRRSHL